MADEGRRPHNSVFLFLYLPFSICSGFFTVTLGFLLSEAGVSAAAIAGIAALCMFPLTWSVVWSPLADSTLSYRAWYKIAVLVIGLGIAVAGLFPATAASLWIFDSLAFITGVASSFIGQVTSAMAAHHAEDGRKGDAAGWAMAGNIGGIGIGGGLGLWLAHHSHIPWLAALVLGVTCFACSAALLFVEEPMHRHRAPHLSATLANIGRDVLAMARSRIGFMAIVLMLMPMGTGAAAGLWSAVAHDWHAGADLVALATGVAGGVISALGALLMGRFSDVIGPKQAYAGGAALMSMVALAMAFAPRTPLMFTLFTLTYAFTNGFMFASFAAVMLEAIGRDCAATKAPLISSLTNIPILVMTLVDGKAQTHFGSGGMLVCEALVSFAAIVVFAAFAGVVRARPAVATA